MPDKSLFSKAVVKIPKRSAFDKSFRNLLTTKCGTLTPILCDELIPNTTVNIKMALSATLPPLASETFMNVNLCVEAFFCPTRLVMLGFEDFIQGKTDLKYGTSINSAVDAKLRVPIIRLNGSQSATTSYLGNGTLADYLGCRFSSLTGQVDINALPFYVYHEIYNSWYRNSMIQTPIYAESFYPSNVNYLISRIKFTKPNSSSGYVIALNNSYWDNVKIGELRQRNFGSDYFTSAVPSPQNGAAQKVSMFINTGNGSTEYPTLAADRISTEDPPLASGKDATLEGLSFGFTDVNGANFTSAPITQFTIASLRAANSLQIWLERNNLCGNRFVDFVHGQYGANLKDSIAQRPVYLGSAKFPVYSKGIYQTSADSNSGNNPFDSVGSRYGHAYAEGTDFIVNHFTAQEPGYLMIIASLVPEVTYSSGLSRMLTRYTAIDSYGDMANPILQNVGMQPIYDYEFDKYLNADDSFGVFGYVDRYADWMTRHHELHGLLRDGGSLQSFALQRGGTSDGISTQFLQIPTDYMDQVTAVDDAISSYGCWIDCYFDYKAVMPLARYSVPSLQDPAYEHGDSVVIDRGGRHID